MANDGKEAIRAMQLQKRRIQQQEDLTIKKKKIEEESRMTSIDNKFKAHYDAVEQLLKTDTIGLVTLEDMKKKRELIIQQREQQLAKERNAKLEEEQERKEKKERQKNEIQKLSFAKEWDEEEDEIEEENEENKESNSNQVKSENKEEDDKDNSASDSTSVAMAKINEENEEEREAFLSSSFKLKKRFGKNPLVDTSFLPDKEREAEEDSLR